MGGGDKFRRELMGTTLIERVRSRLDQQVDCLAVSAARQSRPYDLGMLVIEDEIADAGPLGGIHSALRWAHGVLGRQAAVLTVPADTPFIPIDLASRLDQARQAGAADVAVAVSAGRHPPRNRIVARQPWRGPRCVAPRARSTIGKRVSIALPRCHGHVRGPHGSLL